MFENAALTRVNNRIGIRIINMSLFLLRSIKKIPARRKKNFSIALAVSIPVNNFMFSKKNITAKLKVNLNKVL